MLFDDRVDEFDDEDEAIDAVSSVLTASLWSRLAEYTWTVSHQELQ